MSNDNQFYVYSYLREDGSPYYIGKGKGRRAWNKNHSVNLPLDKNNIVIIKENLSNDEAIILEKNLILQYGRKDLGTGILRNKTNGGEGISEPSLEWRTKKKESMIGDNNPMKRSEIKALNKESQNKPDVVSKKREKMSGELAPHYGKYGPLHPRYGKKDSVETRILKSKSAIGKTKSQQHKDAIGLAHKGISKPNSGWGNKNVRGKKWFNDGKQSFMLFENDERSFNLIRGRIKNAR